MAEKKINPFEYESELETFSAGQTIFKEGEPGKVMYVLAEGKVYIMIRDRVVATLEPQAILGEMALLGDFKRSATAVARTNCKLLPIDEKFFLDLVERSPHFSLQVMRVLADRLRKTDEKL
jgi:CRP-like cAMP-binding protein